MIGADPRVLDRELVELAGRCSLDPEAFVRAAFPWGAGELAGFDGPDEWQLFVLRDVRDGLQTVDQAIRLATSTGHGTGKSCIVAWLLLWAITTCEDTRGVITANTENQLSQKTWAELGKWYRLCLWRDWFTLSATALHSSDPARVRTWRIDAVAWSERAVESFAGLHNQGKRIVVVFDEASAIPDIIWETTEGALTDRDTQIIWAVFGNPTRNTGRFRECFGRYKHRWLGRQVDSRSVKITNKQQIAEWIADNGEDSDFVRVRVRGVFPRAGSLQFIGTDLAEEAAKREAVALLTDALVIGCDVARFGDDQTVIWFRKGRDARSIPPIKLRGADTMQVAARVAAEAERLQADAVFIDATGVGAGVVDRCNQLRVHGVFGVEFGSKPNGAWWGDDAVRVRNMRAQIWATMKSWLKQGAIPNDPALIADLTGVEFGYDADGAIVLESKQDMKRRGLSSPDEADALALTFTYPVAPSHRSGGLYQRRQERRTYEPHANRWCDPQAGL